MKKKDLLCIGTAMVDRIHRMGEISLRPGGEALNESIAAARLGIDVSAVCGICGDAEGKLIEDMLTRNNVDITYACRSGEHHTAVTEMYVAEDGSRRSEINENHKMVFFHPERELDRYPSAEFVSMCSLFRAPYTDPPAIHAVASWAKASGAVLLADTKIAKFEKIGLEDIRDTLRLIDFIFPNEDEAKFYSGEEDPVEAGKYFRDMGVRNVIVKVGSRGSWLINREGEYYCPSIKVDAVDSTGAGDNFIAGFVCGLKEGMDIKESMAFATACAALNVMRMGGCSGAESREEAYALMHSADRRRE